MNEDYSVRSLKQLSQREIFHLLRTCPPELKHFLKVMSSVEGISMALYVNRVLTEHFQHMFQSCSQQKGL